MASIYDLKPKFQGLLRPLTDALARAGITANQVTVAALAVSVVLGAAIYLKPHAAWPLLAMPVLLFVRMALNAIDGMLAREHGHKSRLGAVLNELGDVLADAALYAPLALVVPPGLAAQMVVLIVILGIVAEMTGVIAVQIGAQRRYDGPFGKSDRAFGFGLVCLLLGLGVPPEPWLTPLLAVMAVLSAATIINRARKALAEQPS